MLLSHMVSRLFLGEDFLEDLQRFGICVGVGFDVSFAFVLKDFIDGNEDSRLFHLSEVLVDGSSEHAHGG